MGRRLTSALLVLLMATPALTATAQEAKPGSTSEPAQKPASKPAPPLVTIIGCVQGTGSLTDPFTLLNPQEGVAYKLTGTNMRPFAGKRVQLSGGPDTRRLKVVGGLTPSANVAGQAGAMDPARATVESAPLSTAGKSDPPLPEFRVRSVRSAPGTCDK